jgi:hypothetical protein
MMDNQWDSLDWKQNHIHTDNGHGICEGCLGSPIPLEKLDECHHSEHYSKAEGRFVCPYKEEFAAVLPAEIQKWRKRYEEMHDFEKQLVDNSCDAVRKILSESVRPATGKHAEELQAAITKYFRESFSA